MPTLEAPNQTLSYAREDWTNGYRSQPEEFAYWINDIEGEIPTDLEGTVFRNGPGLTDVNGYRLKHPFDGDGMISSIAFKEGQAFYRNKFVKTEGYIAEQKSGKPEYRGVFGTQKPGGWLSNAFDLRLKNIANTHVVYWGEKLLALWEAAEPHQLDPQTLETVGIDRLGGLLKTGDAFAAHPKFDPNCEGTQRMVNFGVKTGLSSTISLYEFTPDGQLAHQHKHSLPGFAFLHDFAITPNYCIFVQNPVGFNPLPFVFGFKGAAECIQFDPNQPTKIVLIPRNGKDEIRFLETDPCFVFHHANAFEQGDQLILDSVCYDSFPTLDDAEDYSTVDFDHVPASQLWRFTIDLATEKVDVAKIIERPCEFPAMNPEHVGRDYRYLFMGATDGPIKNAPLQALIKKDMKTGEEQLWSAAPRGFGGEPLFVARPSGKAEDDGWVLLWIYNARDDRTELTIFNAQNITSGPVATLKLRHHIPYGLHGSFVSKYFGPKVAEEDYRS